MANNTNLLLKPNSHPRSKEMETLVEGKKKKKETQNHTCSPTLHWSSILYKSLPFVTFFPFTEVMISPKISLP